MAKVLPHDPVRPFRLPVLYEDRSRSMDDVEALEETWVVLFVSSSGPRFQLPRRRDFLPDLLEEFHRRHGLLPVSHLVLERVEPPSIPTEPAQDLLGSLDSH